MKYQFEIQNGRLLDILINNGYAKITIPKEIVTALDIHKRGLYAFFTLDEKSKNREIFEGCHRGYRPVGAEYAGNPNAWDINESFTYSEMHFPLETQDNPAVSSIYETAAKIFDFCDFVVQSCLDLIKEEYNSAKSIPKTRDASWLQTNFYQGRTADIAGREFMQEAHEDGHLFTIWHSTSEGLEVFPTGDMKTAVPIVADTNEMIIFPGDLCSILTGGKIKPLYHQVRRVDTVAQRFAVMYFSNPSIKTPCFPFAPNAKAIDLAELTRKEKLTIRPGVMK